VDGKRIVDRVAAALLPVADPVFIVSGDPAAGSWLPGVGAVPDVLVGRASAIGIHAALVHAKARVIVVGWDMPFVSSALLFELAHRLTGEVSAVVPVGPDGPEGVCAAYAAAAIPVFEREIDRGVVTLSSIIDALPNVVRLGPGEWARFGNARTLFFNVNRQTDLERAEAIARRL
jgi:molybdopterin-guanine dinucleotide biosynthesis protein A